jgi:aspartate ammonia-lyase
LYKKIEVFISALGVIQKAFASKGEEFRDIIKMGRTQLQDAVPMYLGQEFHGYGTSISNAINVLVHAQSLFTDCNMGGTAIGTRINTPEGYPSKVVDYLSQLTGVPLQLSPDLINASYDMSDYVQLSAAIKRSALALSKICNDLRLLSSGPRCGFHEINLPEVQPGSSIMPGKINPVIPEVVNQSAFFVVGADATVCMASEAGQLELNVMEPVVAFTMFNSLDIMTNAVHTLSHKCIKGITANVEVCRNDIANSIGIVTALSPLLGYETTSHIAKEALKSGKSVYQVAVTERKLVTQAQWDEIMDFDAMANPDKRKSAKHMEVKETKEAKGSA